MRRRLAELISDVASRLLGLANRLDPETVQLVEELAEAAPPSADPELVAVAPTRELVIGLTMRHAGPGHWLVIHQPSCTTGPGCTCTPHAIRSQVGVA